MDNNPASWHLLGGHWQSSRFPPTPSRLVRDTLLPCPYAQLHVDRLRFLSIYVNIFSSFHLRFSRQRGEVVAVKGDDRSYTLTGGDCKVVKPPTGSGSSATTGSRGSTSGGAKLD